MKLSEFGEHEFLHSLTKELDITSDDVFEEDNHMLKIDGFRLGYTLPFMTPYDMGWKAVTAAVSDIFGKGGEPKYYLSSIGVNPEREVEELKFLFQGIADAVKYYGGRYVGGDLNSSSEGWIDIAVYARSVCYKPYSLIKENDQVIITNPIGYTSEVFSSLYLDPTIKPSYLSVLKVKHPIVNRHLVNIFQMFCDKISSSTDISDSLFVSLQNVVSETGLGIDIVRLPIQPQYKERLDLLHVDIINFLAHGGEEYESIIFYRGDPQPLLVEMYSKGFRPMVIGRVKPSQGLTFNNQEIDVRGWDNFSGYKKIKKS